MFWLGGLYGDFCKALEKEVDMVTMDSLESQRGTTYGKRFVEEVELDRRSLL